MSAMGQPRLGCTNRPLALLPGTACRSMACNRFRKVEQRLARWLLMRHDRAARDEFPVAREFMAITLGSERPSVSEAAKTRMNTGIVQHAHGKMKILNRPALEARACERYRFTRNRLKAIMGIEIG